MIPSREIRATNLPIHPSPFSLRLSPSGLDFSLAWTPHPALPLDVQCRVGSVLGLGDGAVGAWESLLKRSTLKGPGCGVGCEAVSSSHLCYLSVDPGVARLKGAPQSSHHLTTNWPNLSLSTPNIHCTLPVRPRPSLLAPNPAATPSGFSDPALQQRGGWGKVHPESMEFGELTRPSVPRS